MRQINDRHAGQSGAFVGTATMTGTAPNLEFSEIGTLKINGTEMLAERSYRWSCQKNRATVTFADGRQFHSFILSNGSAEAEHLCGDDLYRVRYHFQDPDQWSATWMVKGPRKDYTMQSDYRRIA